MKGNATIGIDIAKKRHQVCVIDADGNFIGKSFHFENTTSGVEAFLKTVSARVSISEATIGFEATGHYWLPLYHALKRRGICPIVINPAQTKAFSNLELRRVKTDPKDASHIARLMRYGRFSKAYVPEGVVYELRRLTRLRYFLADHRKIMMRRMEACLDVVFPEFENLFRNNFTPTPIQLLSQYTTPKEMLTAGHSPLCNLLKSASRGHLGEDKAKDILLRATKTIGIPDHDEVHKAEITSMISLLAQIESEIKKLNVLISARLEEIPQHLTSIPGIGNFIAASIVSEIGNIHRFPSPKQLVAFAGLDPSVYQTGEFVGSCSHISKRGCSYLRRSIYLAAVTARKYDGDFRDYYQRKVAEGNHITKAIVSVARKMCHTIWRVMIDARPYEG